MYNTSLNNTSLNKLFELVYTNSKNNLRVITRKACYKDKGISLH